MSPIGTFESPEMELFDPVVAREKLGEIELEPLKTKIMEFDQQLVEQTSKMLEIRGRYFPILNHSVSLLNGDVGHYFRIDRQEVLQGVEELGRDLGVVDDVGDEEDVRFEDSIF